MAFSLERTFPITKSCSALPQNLSLVNLPEQRVYHLGVIRKHAVCVASFSPDDNNLSNCRLVESGEKQAESEVIHQAKWVSFGSKTMFVVCSDRGFQVYEADGVSLTYSQSFSAEKKRSDGDNAGARCACALGNRLLIGRSDGSLMSYNLPNFSNGKGETFTCGHSALADIAAAPGGHQIASCDDSGMVVLWTVSASGLQVLSKSRVGTGWPCVAVSFWRRWVIVGAMTGTVYVLDSKDLTIDIEIVAHFRSLTAMDVTAHSSTLGLLLTAGEDTHFRVFAFRENSDSIEVEQCASGVFANQYICGARFLLSGTSQQDLRVALSSYESANIAIYKCKLSS